MATTIKELRAFLDELDDDSQLIAIDHGGLTLVILPPGFEATDEEDDGPMDAFFEIGGVPLKDAE